MEYPLRLEKMPIRSAADGARYDFGPRGPELALNGLIGKPLTMRFDGGIECVACGRATAKSYSQGHCYPCAQRLPACDLCMVSPDRCHFDAGTCRDPHWAREHCHQEHLVYLANTSGLKVGITRAGQVPTRWLDQGAAQALPILRTRTRQQAGLAEAALRAYVGDRTDWRQMLKGEPAPLDLARERDRLLEAAETGLASLRARFGVEHLAPVGDGTESTFVYPVSAYPAKVTALSLDKTPHIAGVLLGIKGQYLIFEGGVFNVRKHSGYQVRLSW